MKPYRTNWGSLKMKIVASSNLWVKRTLKLNTLRGRERRSDWFWQVYGGWRTVQKSASARLMRSFLQAHRAWRGMWPPPKSWRCLRRTESCPLKSNEKSWNPGKTPAKSKSLRRRYHTCPSLFQRSYSFIVVLLPTPTAARSVATFINRAEEWHKDTK